MDGKQQRDQCAGPQAAGHPPQHQEQDHAGRRVQEDIREMISPGLGAIQLAIQHVGDPGQRIPLLGHGRGKRPDNALRGEAAGNVGVVGNQLGVVVVDEFVRDRLGENQRDRQEQARADDRDDRRMGSGTMYPWSARRRWTAAGAGGIARAAAAIRRVFLSFSAHAGFSSSRRGVKKICPLWAGTAQERRSLIRSVQKATATIVSSLRDADNAVFGAETTGLEPNGTRLRRKDMALHDRWI